MRFNHRDKVLKVSGLEYTHIILGMSNEYCHLLRLFCAICKILVFLCKSNNTT